MKKIIVILLLLTALKLSAQEGIRFQQGTWAQARELAIKEKKLIFVDFYTQWCGPCYNMAKNVFTLYSVGTFYNTRFVNMKIDAENGEGIELAKKYGVRSYPTYCYIDPVTEEAVHRSGSNVPAEAFIFNGESALDPVRRSVYLEKERAAGNKSGEFLLAYANYCGSCYKRTEAAEAAQELIRVPGYGLDNSKVWDLFVTYIQGTGNTLFAELKAHPDTYRKLYGTPAVDAKLFAECGNATGLEELPAFNGKEFLIKKAAADRAFRQKNYQEAARYYDELMADPGDFKAELCKALTFLVARPGAPGSAPDFWLDKCLELARYVAYNNPDREDAQVHYTYARHLEMKQQRLNAALGQPAYGAQEYSMRAADLKPKSTRRK